MRRVGKVRGMTRRLLASVVALLLVACGTAPGVRTERADQAPPRPPTDGGSAVPSSQPTTETADTGESGDTGDTGDGVGDVLFPDLGNPGLDVLHYDVDLSYDSITDTIEGMVGLDAALTTDRTEITLDAIGLATSEVTVDGRTARAVTDGPELRITLPEPASAGDEIRIEVAYRAATAERSSAIGLPNGWFNTTGGSYVLNEPDGARTWMPCNDHPSDKATYTFTISVPRGVTAVANGALIEQRAEGTRDVWVWQEQRPMATYLILLLTGDYEVVESTGPGGLPLVSAILRRDRAEMQPFLDVTPEMIEFFEELFGDYPLDGYGIAITDSFGGLAMETQGRSLFSRDDFSDGGLGPGQQLLLAHELAHQWFGDAVTPARWQDIWLNESFATYGQWLWMESIRFAEIDEEAQLALDGRPPGSSADPGVEEMFGYNSYDGGAVVVHALRLTIGDEAFFRLLQQWVAENNGASRTTTDFIALAEEVAGRSLADFFDTWLFATVPPALLPDPA